LGGSLPGGWCQDDARMGNGLRGMLREEQEVKCHEIDATSAPPAGTSAFRAALLEHGALVSIWSWLIGLGMDIIYISIYIYIYIDIFVYIYI